MDSAFKRRWSFEHISIDDGQEVIDDWGLVMPKGIAWLAGVYWNDFRKRVNKQLREKCPGQFREDQLLGPFYFKAHELDDTKLVKNKLLDYLHQHLLRHNPTAIFNPKYDSGNFSDLMKDFDTQNVFLFDFEDLAAASSVISPSTIGTNMITNWKAVVGNIMKGGAPASLEDFTKRRLKATKEVADQAREERGVNEKYETAIHQQLTVTGLFNDSVSSEEFDSIVFDVTQGDKEEFMEKTSNSRDKEGYEEILGILGGDTPGSIEPTLHAFLPEDEDE